MTNKKLSSIEFLFSKIPRKQQPHLKKELQQAKELHKEEILEAFWHGDNTDCISEQNSYDFAKEYYKETFNQTGMNIRELRIGNWYHWYSEGKYYPYQIEAKDFIGDNYKNFEPIPLTEERLLKFGFSVIEENSVGKRYGYVVDGVFSYDLSITFWKSTKEKGKLFKGNLELKSVHQLQNIFFALKDEELIINQEKI